MAGKLINQTNINSMLILLFKFRFKELIDFFKDRASGFIISYFFFIM